MRKSRGSFFLEEHRGEESSRGCTFCPSRWWWKRSMLVFPCGRASQKSMLTQMRYLLFEVMSRAGSTFCPSHRVRSALIPERLGGVTQILSRLGGALRNVPGQSCPQSLLSLFRIWFLIIVAGCAALVVAARRRRRLCAAGLNQCET